ncbi:MAG: hypothetical protein ABIK28_21775 [Planctomycetota bacterium]
MTITAAQRAHAVGTRGTFPYTLHGVGTRGLFLPRLGVITIGAGGQVLFLSAPACVDYLTEEDQVAALFMSPLVHKILTEGAVSALAENYGADYLGHHWQVLFAGGGEELAVLGLSDQIGAEWPSMVDKQGDPGQIGIIEDQEDIDYEG